MKLTVVSGSTGMEIAAEVANILETNLIVPQFKEFRDGESYLRIADVIPEHALVIQSLHQPQELNLFQLLNIVSTLKRLGTTTIIVYTPYLCYARADREILKGEAISSLTVLSLLESVGVNKLITLDIHNPEVFKYSRMMETINIFPSKSASKYFSDNAIDLSNSIVIAPDYGALDRAKNLAEELNLPFLHLNKYRDPHTGEVNIVLNHNHIEAKTVILVDDIISTGGTLSQTASLLLLHDVETIHFVITHILGTEAIERLKEIGHGHVITTNSVPSPLKSISTSLDLLGVLKS
ncbi:MAG: ribose-phosphate diphosphokinase [Candidatus Heimdallarchaeota archaeon]|nr:ribose-phosphate diphosphokinase [Candidatus Heimdallarchaeota archaeon]MDH5645246.1 ribose-phosphate diphosphokinase [Candidatus Heimdallarchaeota archaeon]